jgi:polyisoprenoid-binding protein YceI
MEAVSDAVRYRLLCDSTGSRITRVSASVDVTSFDSGNSNRDSHAMEVIDALTYPDAGFTSTAVSEQGDSLQVTGLLSFHGVSKILVIPGRVDTTADRMTVHAQFSISMTEFKIDRPSLLMIPVADSIRFTLTAVFQRKD